MCDWKEYEFLNLLDCPVRNGIYKKKEFHGRGCKIVNMGELFAFPRIGNVEMKRVELSTKEKERYLLQPGDLIFARRSLTESGAGKCSIIKSISEETTFESSIIRARPNLDIAYPDYLYYYFNSPYGKYLLGTILRQVAVAGITGRDLMQLRLKIPPLPEQKAIASVLSSLDDKIDLLNRQNKTLEAMAETLFRQWFVEEAQEDWEWVKLGQYIEVMRGLSYKGAGLTEKGNGVPMHNLNSVYEGGGYKHEGIKYYSGDYKERHLVKPGDVIITNTEQGHDLLLIGYPAIVPKYFGDWGIFSQHIYRLRLKDKRITEPFLYYLLMSFDVREQIAGATNGSTVNMLSKDGIEWVKLKMPPDEKIKEFTTIVKPLLIKKESNYSQIRNLEEMRDTLLPKLMSGEVRVKL